VGWGIFGTKCGVHKICTHFLGHFSLTHLKMLRPKMPHKMGTDFLYPTFSQPMTHIFPTKMWGTDFLYPTFFTSTSTDVDVENMYRWRYRRSTDDICTPHFLPHTIHTSADVKAKTMGWLTSVCGGYGQ